MKPRGTCFSLQSQGQFCYCCQDESPLRLFLPTAYTSIDDRGVQRSTEEFAQLNYPRGSLYLYDMASTFC